MLVTTLWCTEVTPRIQFCGRVSLALQTIRVTTQQVAIFLDGEIDSGWSYIIMSHSSIV